MSERRSVIPEPTFCVELLAESECYANSRCYPGTRVVLWWGNPPDLEHIVVETRDREPLGVVPPRVAHVLVNEFFAPGRTIYFTALGMRCSDDGGDRVILGIASPNEDLLRQHLTGVAEPVLAGER